MPCCSVAYQQNDVIRKPFRELSQEYIRTSRIAIWHGQKETLSIQRFYCTKRVSVFPYMMTWHGRPLPEQHQQRLGLLILPNPASSSNINRTVCFPLLDRASNTLALIFLRLRKPPDPPPSGVLTGAFSCAIRGALIHCTRRHARCSCRTLCLMLL